MEHWEGDEAGELRGVSVFRRDSEGRSGGLTR